MTTETYTRDQLKCFPLSEFAIYENHRTYGGSMICDTITLIHKPSKQFLCVSNNLKNWTILLVNNSVPFWHYVDGEFKMEEAATDSIPYKARFVKGYRRTNENIDRDIAALHEKLGIKE